MSNESPAEQFLEACPEWRSETRMHPEYGLVMSSAATVAFINWAVENKLCDPAKAAGLRVALERKTAEWKGAT